MVRDEGSSVRHGVEERPESAIATAVVVAVEEIGLSPDGNDLKQLLSMVYYV